jgi:hypothetical protein
MWEQVEQPMVTILRSHWALSYIRILLTSAVLIGLWVQSHAAGGSASGR